MITSDRPLSPHADRLLPAEPAVRDLARELYHAVAGAPIVSPHGHIDARVLAEDKSFGAPAAFLITPDHYVTRLLHAAGLSLEQLGVGEDLLSEDADRAIWRLVCSHWDAFRGTPVRYWLETELYDIFDVRRRPSAASADAIYDHVANYLQRDDYRPRALFQRFRIKVLATTDDPCDDLSAHETLAADPTWNGRVIPTFRPDRYLEIAEPGWRTAVDKLATVSHVDTGDYIGYIRALEVRREYFKARGATATDHGHADARAESLSPAEATRIYMAARQGTITDAEGAAFRRHMMLEMARMSVDDGLVMAMHPGVCRNHHAPTFDRYGPDTGHDIPLRIEFTMALRPLLERFGTHPNFRLVLFTVDETAFSREIAPLASFYPSVYAGAPWWFLDAPEAIRRFRSALTETAGFDRTSGFIDDTRAFCSIPARHDMSRRLDAGYLARLVAEHQLDDDEAFAIAADLVGNLPLRVFRL